MSPIRREQNVRLANEHLRTARDLFKSANARQTLKRVRSAIRSGDGALRNARRFANQKRWAQ